MTTINGGDKQQLDQEKSVDNIVCPVCSADNLDEKACLKSTNDKPDNGHNENTKKAGPDAGVASIKKGSPDARGEEVQYIYFKRDRYAVYLTIRGQIAVKYSDDSEEAGKQICRTSGLLPQRNGIINLIGDLPSKYKLKCKDGYLEQIAEALRLGLEERQDIAIKLLDGVRLDLLDKQGYIGRMYYLLCASVIMAVSLGIIALSEAYIKDIDQYHLLLMATGAGAVGALLSIAIGIRRHTVSIQRNWLANTVDAAVRVLIGIISAVVLFLIFYSGILTDIQAGVVKLTGQTMTWPAAVLIGFSAGFLERLVPDLLEKSASVSNQSTDTPPNTRGTEPNQGAV